MYDKRINIACDSITTLNPFKNTFIQKKDLRKKWRKQMKTKKVKALAVASAEDVG